MTLKFLPITIKSLLGSWNHMGWAAPSLINNVEEKRKASSHRKVLQITGTKCITEFCMKWLETNHLRTVKATLTQTDPWIDLSHFVIWPSFCYLKFLLCLCLWVGPFCVIWFKALFFLLKYLNFSWLNCYLDYNLFC